MAKPNLGDLIPLGSDNNYADVDKAKVDAIPENPQYTDTTYTAGTNIEINSGAINNIITDQGTDPDWVGVKYKWVMIDGELFAEVVAV